MPNGVPDVPLDSRNRYLLDHIDNPSVANRIKLADFLKKLMQKLDADTGITDTDFESLFTPD